MILLDVGVLLAAVWGGHVRHPLVAAWFARQSSDLALCRMTQMRLLRLITNPAVMGVDAVDRSVAWLTVDQLRADPRVRWVPEPPHVEVIWRALSAQPDGSHKVWTDDYLAAFAQASGVALATLDQGYAARYKAIRVETLR